MHLRHDEKLHIGATKLQEFANRVSFDRDKILKWKTAGQKASSAFFGRKIGKAFCSWREKHWQSKLLKNEEEAKKIAYIYFSGDAIFEALSYEKQFGLIFKMENIVRQALSDGIEAQIYIGNEPVRWSVGKEERKEMSDKALHAEFIGISLDLSDKAAELLKLTMQENGKK